MDSWVGNQIGLKFGQVHIQSAVKPQRRRDGGDYLGNEPVQIGVCGLRDVEICPAKIVDGLIVHKEGNIRVFQCRVGK